jgi:murein DD-endopeptidase MepM/ murein hydrolase activator NlpD
MMGIRFVLKKPILLSVALMIILAILLPVGKVGAQTAQPEGQVYMVQPGDTLSGIAARFGVSVDDLIRANGITDPNKLAVGTRLIIPGPGTLSGEVVTVDVPYGATLRSFSRRYQLSETDLAHINRITSPAEIYVGSSLILPKAKADVPPGGRAAVTPGQSLFELAVINGSDPWTLASTNALSGTWDVLSGDVLQLPAGTGTSDGPGALPQIIKKVNITPQTGVQGKALVIHIATQGDIALRGNLIGYPLHFFPDPEGGYTALQGIYAKTDPGLYALTITGTLQGGNPFNFSQMVMVQSGNYMWEDVTGVPEATLDPAVTQPEDKQWYALAAPATPVKTWDGIFQNPVPLPHNDCFPFNPADPYHCWISLFGTRRSYNGGPRDFYHSGLDMYAGMGVEIHAAASGVVVFAGWLDVRGNATMIDHGWGVYSAYLHQSEFKVKVGDKVEAGQVIGLVGGTGRAGGPHLHFEILVGDLPVNPLDWLQQAYP